MSVAGQCDAVVRATVLSFKNHLHHLQTPLRIPTLLFANAGMNQVLSQSIQASLISFTLAKGQINLSWHSGTRTHKCQNPNAFDSQKCIRDGGKHSGLSSYPSFSLTSAPFSDLEDFGDSYHHTLIFWELLQDFSLQIL